MGGACLHERDRCERDAVRHVPDCPDGGNVGAAELVHDDCAALLRQLDARLCMRVGTGTSASHARQDMQHRPVHQISLGFTLLSLLGEDRIP